MKNLKTILFVVMLLVLAGFAMAEETATTTTTTATETEITPVEPGITPDSPLYGLDRAWERITLAMTFGSDKKVAKGLENARERIAEAKAMIEEKKFDDAEKAKREHVKIMDEVKKNVNEIKDSDTEEQLKKELKAESDVEEQETEISEVATKIKIEFEGTLTPEQQAKIDELIASLKTDTNEVKVKILEKKDRTKIELKAKTGKTDQEIDEKEKELEEENEREEKAENLGGEAQSATVIMRNAADKIDDAKEIIAEFNLTGTDAETHLNNAIALLNESKTAFDAGDYATAKTKAQDAMKEAMDAAIRSKMNSENEGQGKEDKNETEEPPEQNETENETGHGNENRGRN